jgi:hypothetical protein
MRFLSLLPVLSLFSGARSTPFVDPATAALDVAAEISKFKNIDSVDRLAATGLVKLAAWQAVHDRNNPCTIATAVKRREW